MFSSILVFGLNGTMNQDYYERKCLGMGIGGSEFILLIQISNDQNSNLKTQLDNLNSENNIDENNKSIINQVNQLADEGNYERVLAILNDVKNKTSEMNLIIADCSKKYETQTIEKVSILKTDKKNDEALLVLKKALNVLPNNESLEKLNQEILNSYPKNMIDIVPAYQYGGNPYKEYSSTKSGGTDYFKMAGIKYTDGTTFSADRNVWEDISWAVYNLNKKYTNLEFTVCHVDGTDNGENNTL